jgi:hypothetical protein
MEALSGFGSPFSPARAGIPVSLWGRVALPLFQHSGLNIEPRRRTPRNIGICIFEAFYSQQTHAKMENDKGELVRTVWTPRPPDTTVE